MRKENSTNYTNEKDLLETCGMFYTISMIGGRWKVSIIAALLDHKSLRYSELLKLLPSITERMLIKQLKELQQNGLVHRNSHNVVPPRVDYSLTSLGESLKEVLLVMHKWGKKHKNES
ncbi:MAG: winged helix-turn-helix transcriptional regulator [Cellulophaga sp.]